MYDTTNIIEALALGMLFGAIAGAVASAILSSSGTARRRAADRDRLVRMQRYLADAQGARRTLTAPSGLELRLVEPPVKSPLDVLIEAANSTLADPPCSAAGGSFGVRPAPTLTLVNNELDQEVSR